MTAQAGEYKIMVTCIVYRHFLKLTKGIQNQQMFLVLLNAGGQRGDGSVMTTAALEVNFDDYFMSSGGVFMELLGLRPH